MKILHGTWIPEAQSSFVQTGAFSLWVETAQPLAENENAGLATASPQQIVQHLEGADLAAFLVEDLGLPDTNQYNPTNDISAKFFELPSLNDWPLPSLELARYLEQDLPDAFSWQTWQIDCYRVNRFFGGARGEVTSGISAFIAQLKEIHFIAQYQLAEVQLGAELLFWYHYLQSFKEILLKDQYIPSLRYREVRRGKQKKAFETYPHWEIVSGTYEENIQRYADYMPAICAADFAEALDGDDVSFHDKEALLRHCSECLLHDVVTKTPLPQSFYKQLEGSLIYSCLKSTHWTTSTELSLYKQWRPWRDRVARTQSSVPFYLCFQLQSPTNPEDDWEIAFKVAPKQHPSLRISLADYWRLRPHQQMALKLQLGESFEQELLFALGDAARIYPPMWEGLETDEPDSIFLDVDAAFDFLSEAAWILEDAGCKVIVPSWWTPQNKNQTQMKQKASP